MGFCRGCGKQVSGRCEYCYECMVKTRSSEDPTRVRERMPVQLASLEPDFLDPGDHDVEGLENVRIYGLESSFRSSRKRGPWSW